MKRNNDIRIEYRDGQPVITSTEFCKLVGREHRQITKLIRKYAKELQEMDELTSEHRLMPTNGGDQSTKVFILSEKQAKLLWSFLRHNKSTIPTLKVLSTAFKNALPDEEINESMPPMVDASLLEEIDELKQSVTDHNASMLAQLQLVKDVACSLGVPDERDERLQYGLNAVLEQLEKQVVAQSQLIFSGLCNVDYELNKAI